MSQHAPTTARIAGIEQEIFRLNLGGNTFGWTSDEQQSFDVLDTFVAAGGNFVDTADMYSVWAEGHEGGESETVLGRWFAARGFLVTPLRGRPSTRIRSGPPTCRRARSPTRCGRAG